MQSIGAGGQFDSALALREALRRVGGGRAVVQALRKLYTLSAHTYRIHTLDKFQPLRYATRMELDLDLPFRTRGRAARPIIASVVRPLDRADLVLLQEEKGSQASALKRLSERHHALARNLASGMAPGEAGILCGYSNSRVSILQDDPAFKELVEFYRRDVEHQYRDLHTRLSGLALDAAEELAERLEEDASSFSIGQLMETVKMGADRTGFGPQSSSTNVNVNVDLAGRLEAARKRVAARQLEAPQ